MYLKKPIFNLRRICLIPFLAVPLGLNFSLSTRPHESIEGLDQLARTRNSSQLKSYLAPESTSKNIFSLLTTGGVYGVGRKGWHCEGLTDPTTSTNYVVFTTPLTSEDIGDLLFKLTPGGLVYIPEDQTFGARFTKHDFDVRFDTATKIASIKDQCELIRGSDGLTMFRLSPCYRMSSIESDEHPVEFHQAGGIVLMTLTAGTHELKIAYSGKVDLPGYAGSIDDQEALFVDDYWYPMIARYPVPYSVTCHAPKGWKVIGQGNLNEHKSLLNEEVYRYDMPLPVSIYSLIAGNYREATFQGKRKIHVWSRTISDSKMQMLAQFYPDIIDFYSKIFKPYPFSSYGAVVSTPYGGGALEGYSFATYGSLDGEDSHEPSHTWWGGMIPNTYLHSLWNESFADYCMELCAQGIGNGSGDEKYAAFCTHPSVHGDDGKTTIEGGGAFSGSVASYLGYGKGSYVLMMLDDEIGRDKVIQCMRQWLSEHDPKLPGEWQDFENVVEEVEGKNFDWFMQQWLRRPGYPNLQISNVKKQGNRINFTAKFAGPTYREKMPILIVSSAGIRTFENIEIPAEQSSNLSVAAPMDASLISFDPYRQLLRKINPNENPISASSFWSTAQRVSYGAPGDAYQGLHLDAFSTNLAQLRGIAIYIDISKLDTTTAKKLISKAGFRVSGTKLNWKNTTIDLTNEGARALIPLGSNGYTMIELGNPAFLPLTGDAQIALYNHLGKFLAGETAPKTSGYWVFRL